MPLDLSSLVALVDVAAVGEVIGVIAVSIIAMRVVALAVRRVVDLLKPEYSDSQWDGHAEANRHSGADRPW